MQKILSKCSEENTTENPQTTDMLNNGPPATINDTKFIKIRKLLFHSKSMNGEQSESAIVQTVNVKCSSTSKTNAAGAFDQRPSSFLRHSFHSIRSSFRTRYAKTFKQSFPKMQRNSNEANNNNDRNNKSSNNNDCNNNRQCKSNINCSNADANSDDSVSVYYDGITHIKYCDCGDENVCARGSGLSQQFCLPNTR